MHQEWFFCFLLFCSHSPVLLHGKQTALKKADECNLGAGIRVFINWICLTYIIDSFITDSKRGLSQTQDVPLYLTVFRTRRDHDCDQYVGFKPLEITLASNRNVMIKRRWYIQYFNDGVAGSRMTAVAGTWLKK